MPLAPLVLSEPFKAAGSLLFAQDARHEKDAPIRNTWTHLPTPFTTDNRLFIGSTAFFRGTMDTVDTANDDFHVKYRVYCTLEGLQTTCEIDVKVP